MHGLGKRWKAAPYLREHTYNKRAAEEWKNVEMKRFHGLARATRLGLAKYGFPSQIHCNSGVFETDSEPDK